jgi:hypothetical protein
MPHVRYTIIVKSLEEQKSERDARWRQQVADLADQYAREAQAANVREAWEGTARVARWIENRLLKAGIEYERSGYQADSQYFRIRNATGGCIGEIRVSDHPQPVGGGYSAERGERYGEADISVEPDASDWRAAVQQAIRWVREDSDEA